MKNSLRDRTRRLLIYRSRSVTYEDIVAATGLKKSWLEKFAQDQIPDPGVEKIETLFNFFSGKKLAAILDECGG